MFKNINYYLTLFKVEGNPMWKTSLSGYSLGFKVEIENNIKSKITHKKTYLINRTTGEIKLKNE